MSNVNDQVYAIKNKFTDPEIQKAIYAVLSTGLNEKDETKSSILLAFAKLLTEVMK
jgi:hypothetical protein